MNSSRAIYLDHNATTPMDPRVFEAMRPYFMEEFGNAASGHVFGRHAADAVAKSRQQVAKILSADPRGIVFTSGATESNNLALKGIAEAYRDKGKHLITQVTEHKCVIDTCHHLERLGYEITWLGVDKTGRIRIDELKDALRPDTLAVSIMWANNETGTVQPMREIAQLCKEAGVLFHTDATQAVGKLPIDVNLDGIDLLSLSAHKFYGPKGSGVLYVKRDVRLIAQIDGGGHQDGMRSGTLNVTGIVGLGAACEVAQKELAEESKLLRSLRDRLEWGIRGHLHDIAVNGNMAHRLPHVTNLAFPGVDSSILIRSLNDVAVSSGSACSTGSTEPSYVLKALGIPRELAQGSIRFSLGRSNDEKQIDRAVERVVAVVNHLRGTVAVH